MGLGSPCTDHAIGQPEEEAVGAALAPGVNGEDGRSSHALGAHGAPRDAI